MSNYIILKLYYSLDINYLSINNKLYLHYYMLKYISIYRDSDEFWSFYPPQLKLEYDACKKKHDPDNRFISVADKLSR